MEAVRVANGESTRHHSQPVDQGHFGNCLSGNACLYAHFALLLAKKSSKNAGKTLHFHSVLI
jgi:hypothetical protein